MADVGVFVCYDFDHDHGYDFFFRDLQRLGKGRIRFLVPPPRGFPDPNTALRNLAADIRQTTMTLVIVGNHANSFHQDRLLIGERNWQWWMIKQARMAGHPFAGVRIEPENEIPRPLRNLMVTWATALRPDTVIAAVTAAKNHPVRSG